MSWPFAISSTTQRGTTQSDGQDSTVMFTAAPPILNIELDGIKVNALNFVIFLVCTAQDFSKHFNDG
ncbi:MAG: hypothetical protein CMA99_02370 [Euryarchaeota archaeon]|nr:hypothetical protein [Euryarchaeota archaeon]